MNPFQVVKDFECAIAEYTGAPYAISTDSCTSALLLACAYHQVKLVTLPSRTYPSVPCSVIHAGGFVQFRDYNWKGIYQLEPYPIYDAAKRFTRGMYIPSSYMCLSFHMKKILPIGRGGMILTDDKNAVDWFKIARFDGRHECPLSQDTYAMVGWNVYMTPDQAARGLQLLSNVKDDNEDQVECPPYPDLSQYSFYTKR